MSTQRVGPAQVLRTLIGRPESRPVATGLAGSVLVQAVGVVTGVVLARALGPADRGVVAAIILWPSVAVAVGDLGYVSAFGYYSAKAEGSLRPLAKFAVKASFLQSAYLVPVTLLVSWAALRKAGVDDIGIALVLAFAFVPAALLSRYVAAILQGQVRIGAHFGVRLSMAVTVAIGLGVLLVTGGVGVKSAIGAHLAGLAAMSLLCGIHLRRFNRSPGRRADVPVRAFTRFGLKALPGGLYPIDVLFADQMLVALFLGPYDLGLYATAAAFTALPRVLGYGIGAAAMPLVARSSPERLCGELLRLMGLSLVVVVPACVALVIGLPVLLPALFGDPFRPAVACSQLLVVGSGAYTLRRIIGDSLRGAGAPGVVSVVEMGSWPAVVIAAALATRSGITAVAGALLAVQVVALVLMVVLGRRVRPTEPRPVSATVLSRS